MNWTSPDSGTRSSATPRNDTESFTRITAEERLTSVFGAVDASVIVCGHTHMQFDRIVAGRRVVNAGSIGMPFAAPRGAYWLLLGADVQLRRTEYDFFEKAPAHVRATAYPQAETLAVRYIIDRRLRSNPDDVRCRGTKLTAYL